ncbi:uncharacterized protein N7459_006473 [Penicillium hispanicum]|uniref:uncharacterized protein n=1 Tax=Penicillium hispanicum TaxID=1080232 RepID=UPI00253FDB0A|nr:uncharacterized protein N7459_006473 [Penicillium hispanicum]KAJ5577509.1 hypothetical protein N7459_006473 [Penicillium hispanicum]
MNLEISGFHKPQVLRVPSLSQRRNYYPPASSLRIQVPMFRCAIRPFVSLPSPGRAAPARYFHRVTGDFLSHDTRGNPVSTKVPVIIGDPGETYVLIDPEIGRALRAGILLSDSTLATSVEDRCRLTFFHESRHFGFVLIFMPILGSSTYPRLHIPENMPHQTDSNTSPATLLLFGKMHQIVLDGTPDAPLRGNLGRYLTN